MRYMYEGISIKDVEDSPNDTYKYQLPGSDHYYTANTLKEAAKEILEYRIEEENAKLENLKLQINRVEKTLERLKKEEIEISLK